MITWSLGSSESVQNIIKEKYKQQRHDDDKNQPLSVQSWGRDGDKRRYWLIEGHDDTHFRLYRESNPALKHVTWRSVAGTIDELKQVAARLEEDGSQAARKLCDSINAGIPRFEAGEDVSPPKCSSEMYTVLTSLRKGSGESIAWLEKPNLLDQSLDFPFTKVVLEERE